MREKLSDANKGKRQFKIGAVTLVKNKMQNKKGTVFTVPFLI